MANNFFLSQDPLLYQGPFSKFGENDEDMRQKLNNSLMQYRMLQQQQQAQQQGQQVGGGSPQKDYVGDLDTLIKDMGEEVSSRLKDDPEYRKLTKEFNDIVQCELMNCIRYKINTNQTAIKNMERQSEIIRDMNRKVEEDNRRSINEINDYVKNYSNMTFDEYRRIKNGELTVSPESSGNHNYNNHSENPKNKK